MKPSAKRLGRGLGAFLDFGPSGDEPPAYRPDEAGEEPKSVLQTSVAPPAVALPPSRPPEPPPPPAASRLPPASVPAPVREAPPAPRVSSLPAASPAPRPAPPEPEDDAPFVDEIVGGLTFPDVDLS